MLASWIYFFYTVYYFKTIDFEKVNCWMLELYIENLETRLVTLRNTSLNDEI